MKSYMRIDMRNHDDIGSVLHGVLHGAMAEENCKTPQSATIVNEPWDEAGEQGFAIRALVPPDRSGPLINVGDHVSIHYTGRLRYSLRAQEARMSCWKLDVNFAHKEHGRSI